MDGIFINRRGTGRFWEDIVKSDYYVKKVLAEEIGLAITGQTQANQTGYVKHEDSGGHFTSGTTTVLGEVKKLDDRLYKWTNQDDTVYGSKTIITYEGNHSLSTPYSEINVGKSGSVETRSRIDIANGIYVGTNHEGYRIELDAKLSDIYLHSQYGIKLESSREITIEAKPSILGPATVNINGDVLKVEADLNVSGSTVLGNSCSQTVDLKGKTNIYCGLDVSGVTTFHNDVNISGNTHISGDTLTIKAGTTVEGKFDGLLIASATTSGANVRAEWKLVDKAGNEYGEHIKIYKDNSLADVSLVDLHEQPSDWPSGQTYKDGQYLRFDYEDSEGGHDIVYVDVSLMLVESEFASGVTATSAGIVRGVVDPNSQKDTNNNHYLTVGANGFKISGINEAINKAITGVTSGLTVIDSPVDKQFVTAVSEEDGIITVSRKQPTFADISGRTTDTQHHAVSSTGATAETGKWVKSIAVDQYGHITGTTTTQPTFDDIAGNIPVTKLPTGSTTQYGIVKVTNGNGLSIDAGVISMASATTAAAGAVTTGAQTFAGDKTFNNNLTVNGNTQLGNATGDTLTICGNTTANGGISATTGFWQTSDERMKLFIDEVNGDLEKIKQIPTKRFYWRTQPDGPLNIGTSAQKIKDLYPEIVSGDETLSVDYSKFGIIAIAAIKELTAKVEYLEERLKQLENN